MMRRSMKNLLDLSIFEGIFVDELHVSVDHLMCQKDSGKPMYLGYLAHCGCRNKC